jgi:hypothetical protein
MAADTWKLWDDYALVNDLQYYHGPEFLERAMKLHADGEYVDVHAWVFTPWHFMRLMRRMVDEMGLKFDLKFFLTTQDHDLEFYVQLERVEIPTTDWAAEAENAERTALWPHGTLEMKYTELRSQLEKQNAELRSESQKLRAELRALASALQAERSLTMLERAKLGLKARIRALSPLKGA